MFNLNKANYKFPGVFELESGQNILRVFLHCLHIESMTQLCPDTIIAHSYL